MSIENEPEVFTAAGVVGGFRHVARYWPPDRVEVLREDPHCTQCKGSGVIGSHPCSECGGKGAAPAAKLLPIATGTWANGKLAVDRPLPVPVMRDPPRRFAPPTLHAQIEQWLQSRAPYTPALVCPKCWGTGVLVSAAVSADTTSGPRKPCPDCGKAA